jgi:hypothetical protein
MRAPKLNEKLTVTEDEMFEMSNLSPVDTGLTHRIWISVNVNHRHPRPQLRVEGPNRKFYPMSLDDPVEFLAGRPAGLSAAQSIKLRRFVKLNREVLLAHWNDEIDTATTIHRLQHI